MDIQDGAHGRPSPSGHSPVDDLPVGHSPAIGWGALLSGGNGVRSLALAGGVALHAINVYIATTMLPSVVRDIGGLDLYAWNTTVFVVASIVSSALSAKLLQHAGPRRAYATAAMLFAAGTAACALAPTMPVMLIGRLVQGFGGGFLLALAYAMIRFAFAEALWPRAMALVSGMWGIATLVGPAVGGLFAELGLWRAAFWSLAPVSVLFALLAATVLPRRDSSRDRRSEVPLPQLALLTAAVLAISAGSMSPDPMWNAGGVAAAAIFAALLVATEARSARKLLPSGAFRASSAIAPTYAMIALLTITVTAGEVFAPLFLQVLHDQSPLAAGYLTALMAGGWTLGSVGSAAAVGRSVRRAVMAGPLLALLGTISLWALMPLTSGGSWLVLAPLCMALLAIGFGIGITWPHLLIRALKAVAPAEQQLAGAAITTVQLFAAAAGAAVAGMVVNAGGLLDPGGIAGTAGAARWLFATLLFAPLLCILAARRVAGP